MSTLSSANVTDVNLVLKERTHMRLCLNVLIFTHNLGNWLIISSGGCSHVCLTDNRGSKPEAKLQHGGVLMGRCPKTRCWDH